MSNPSGPQKTTESRYKLLGGFIGFLLGFGVWILFANLFAGGTNGLLDFLANAIGLLGCPGFPLIGAVLGYNFFYTVTRTRF